MLKRGTSISKMMKIGFILNRDMKGDDSSQESGISSKEARGMFLTPERL